MARQNFFFFFWTHVLNKKAVRVVSDGLFTIYDLRFTVSDFRKPQIVNRKSYFLMNVFVTMPSSMVMRTK